MRETLFLVRDFFPKGNRRGLVVVLLAIVVAGFFETLGVASILPFMAVAADPSVVHRYAWLQRLAHLIGLVSTKEVVIGFGVLSGVSVLAGNVATATSLYLVQRLSYSTVARLARTVFYGFLRRPYAFHVENDAATLSKLVLVDSKSIVDDVVAPILNATSRIFVTIGVLTLLVLQNPSAAFVVLVVLLLSYGILIRGVRRLQRFYGERANQANRERYRSVQEGLGGIKELLVLDRLGPSLERFRVAQDTTATAGAVRDSLSQLPRYALESIAFGGILLAALVAVVRDEAAIAAVVPTLALYAFAGYRLIPAMQHLYIAMSQLQFHKSMLADFHREFMIGVAAEQSRSAQESKLAETAATDGGDQIVIDGVSFRYAGTTQDVLRDVTLRVRRGETIGFVGRTGAGKTTLADLILGLFEPSFGSIRINGAVVTAPEALPRGTFGYVPQTVYLADTTIAENIAFGIPEKDRDDDAMLRAARMADADEFIRKLPNGYETIVGERGVRLSGGQRQRLGIARALYHDPQILIFDEATGALDGLTEEAVMNAIRSLAGTRTVILMAHRLRTVEACDRIVLLDRGSIECVGSYDELLQTSDRFRQMVRGSVSTDPAATATGALT